MKKYKVIKPFEARKWEIGDIVAMDELSGNAMLEKGYAEIYEGTEPNKHTAITVDAAKLSAINKN